MAQPFLQKDQDGISQWSLEHLENQQSLRREAAYKAAQRADKKPNPVQFDMDEEDEQMLLEL